ncbi:hypothetical protein N7474_011089 [Penicillium riverlandense]|uniref:uncharacterized protein n=1 Tax=Penicillium riverlandense TaxID=1903569 RepID=UPI002548EF6C|nr:uncharacterized protein N7474_011089 [Penicillium riverlandense]KAJ5805202.1 hypothetical protein N7474_011089 [Penicillium riverlandense]
MQWYNAHTGVDSNTHRKKGRIIRGFRANQLSLHTYQSAFERFRCGVLFKAHGLTSFEKIASIQNAHLEFSMRGGAEIPHFHLDLVLKVRDDFTPRLTMVWTAWDGESNWNERDPASNVDTRKPLTFSARLSKVEISKILLDQEKAALCRGKKENEAYTITWTWKNGPHCLNHDLPTHALESLDGEQRKMVEKFHELGQRGHSIRVITTGRSHLSESWNAFSAMPNPTPPPYPYYNCSYILAGDKFSVMDDIPEVSDKIIEMHHRKRRVGWPNAPSGDMMYEPRMELLCFTTYAPLTFVNEREYEVLKMIGLLREAAAEGVVYVSQFNRRYKFNLHPIPGSSAQQGGSSDWYYAALEVNTLHNENINLEQILPLPEPGTPVEINPVEKTFLQMTGSSRSRTWIGTVISASAVNRTTEQSMNFIFIRIKRLQDRESIEQVLTLEGDVHFGSTMAAKAQARKAIRYAMYGNTHLKIPRGNKMKQLLLGHQNKNIKLHLPPELEVDDQAETFLRELQSEGTLNAEQIRAVRSALNAQTSFRDFMGLVEAPPGTGKTMVSAVIAQYCHQHGKPILIVCGSNYGLDVITDRIRSILKINNSTDSSVYRLDTDFRESAEMQMSPLLDEDPEQPEATWGDPRADAKFYEVERDLIERGFPKELHTAFVSALRAMTPADREFSLGNRILQRIENAVRTGRLRQPELDEESMLILQFLTYQELLRREAQTFWETADYEDELATAVRGETSDDESQTLHKRHVENYRKWWLALQEFYLKKAKVVLCTASTAGRKSLCSFQPEIVLVEEASQITEQTCLIPIMRNYANLTKVILSGDKRQLPPIVLSAGQNECYNADKMSLFERMLDSGVSTVSLRVQYRMAKDICDFVNAEYYEGRLTTDLSCIDRPNMQRFADFVTELFPQCARGTSYFLSVENSALWKQRNGTSVFNPDYIQIIARLVTNFMEKGCKQTSILILSFYSEERNLLRKLIHEKLGHKNIRISSVDAAQGAESPYVVLSTTRPGHPWGMGFITDRNRQCVSLSRARDGLIIVGHETMGTIITDRGSGVSGGQGTQAWGRLVKKHKDGNRLVYVRKADLAWLKKEIDVPNANQHVRASYR